MKRSFPATACLLAILLLNALGVQAESCLWKISSKKGTMYIQGSSHILKPDHYPLAPAIETAYLNSSALVLEVDMAEMLSPKTQQLIMETAMLEQPQTLQSVLSPATYEKLASACNDASLPVEAIHPYKPWFATTTLTLVKLQKLGFDSGNGLDKYFYDKAIADSKPVTGLETLSMQINLFDSLSNTNPDDYVNRALKEIDLLEPQINELITAWQTGNSESLDKLMSASFEGYPELYNTFVNNRNKDWAQKLSKMVSKDATYMVVVGAGHLPGEEGLIKLMEAKGFMVEQL